MSEKTNKRGGRLRRFHPLRAVRYTIFVPEGMGKEYVRIAQEAIRAHFERARKEIGQ